jgi:hypothetical protein
MLVILCTLSILQGNAQGADFETKPARSSVRSTRHTVSRSFLCCGGCFCCCCCCCFGHCCRRSWRRLLPPTLTLVDVVLPGLHMPVHCTLYSALHCIVLYCIVLYCKQS